jgi:hypothetical protein
LGIVIGIFFNEHSPAHFQAVYGEHKITVEIESGMIRGAFPPRALRLVLEWATLHRLGARHVSVCRSSESNRWSDHDAL